MKQSKIILTIVVIYLCSTVNCRRVRRNLLEFKNMISMTTDRNPMDFLGYGNWCGYGGEGDTVDTIDECCRVHDGCYLQLQLNECKTLRKYEIYVDTYQWSSIGEEIICYDEDPCNENMCMCDRAAAQCFGKHKNEYNTENKHNWLKKAVEAFWG